MDLVSIIIPTFGRPNHLLRAIDSVLQQTYKNIEIIVVDDNGRGTEMQLLTDRTLSSYVKDGKCQYVTHEHNKNGSAARNTGFRISHGKYVGFLDDDDVFLPTKIEKQVDKLSCMPSDFGAAYCNTQIIHVNRNGKTELLVSKEEGDLTHGILMGTIRFNTSTLLFRREVIEHLNGFDESFKRHQDWELLIRFFRDYKVCIASPETFLLVKYNFYQLVRHSYDKNAIAYREKFLNKYEADIKKFSDANRIYHHQWLSVSQRMLSDMDLKDAMHMIRRTNGYGRCSIGEYIILMKFFIIGIIKKFISKKVLTGGGKIGILTHHYVKNFGAYMQAKALISVIKQEFPNVEVEVIDFRVKKHEWLNTKHFFGFKPKRGDTLHGFLRKMQLYHTHKTYEKLLPKSRRVNCADEINSLAYDLIIVGSDEVWNFKDMAYSPLKFGVGLDAPHITYSASVGGSTAQERDVPEEIMKGISGFKDIAVRDQKSEEMVKAFTGRDTLRTLDPVYLYDFKLDVSDKIEHWVECNPYILIYDCRLGNAQIKELKEYAQTTGLNILGAGEHRNWYTTDDTVNITPYEWAYLFKNAAYVVTGTFHGTSFAIKYGRQFVAYLTEQNRINKVGSLLADFELEKQIAGAKDNIVEVMTQEVDYYRVDELIAKKKDKSLTYLFTNISACI